METEQLYHRFLDAKARATLQMRWFLDDLLHSTGRHHGLRQDWKTAWHFVAIGREMKVILVFLIVLVAAATAFAYAPVGVGAGVSAVASQAFSEPTVMLFSGATLLGIAGAVRRFPF